ncbi:MAG: hypothetical protein QM752_02135 [Gammaproteobacteria bacterium]
MLDTVVLMLPPTEVATLFQSNNSKLFVRKSVATSVTLHGWVKRYGPNTKTDAGSSSKIDAHAEIQRLKKENARLQMERDILKKAAAYFAGDQL